VGRTSLEEAVGEAAGGRGGVERERTGDVERERVERVSELLAAAADEARWWPGDAQRVGGSHEAGRLVGDGAVDEHPVGLDQLLGLAAPRGERTSDELGVEPTAGGQFVLLAGAASVSSTATC
jgi:hypothetical protein